MRAKTVLHSLIALLLVLPTFGGTLQAQNSAATCSGKAAMATGITRQTLEAGGLTRSYLLYVPPLYDPAQPTPLVFSLHGFASNARQQAIYSRWDRTGAVENFIVVYPNGTGTPPRWNAGQHEIPGIRTPARGLLQQFLSSFFETVPVDDVAFMRELIAHLSDQLCIDPARIYVTGISNGGGMTNRLACELSDEIAAIGTVAGAYTEFPGGCNPTRPVPVIAFHGMADPIVPYNGNAETHFPAIKDWVVSWATRDRCSLTPETIAGTVGDVSGVKYTGCADNAEVDFYTIRDGGHTWPGGLLILPFLLGKTTKDIDATATMWQFFKAHPMQ